MTKRYLKFIYYYLLTIFLFCTCCFIVAKSINYYVTITTHKIKIHSVQELKNEFLSKQPKPSIQNINVKSRNDIPKIMELLGINGVSISSPNPSYNSNYSECIIWNLKNPQDGLLDVYFKPRPNPFKITYPYSHNEYTLDELLTHKIAIEKAYVFWDISKAQIDPNVNIHTINLNYDANTTEEAALKKYLTETIKTNDRYVELGCYNAVSNEAIIVPFNSNRYFYHNNNKIEAVYFDDGVRVFTNCYNTDGLTKHANGAKNIYLFNFTLVKINREIDIPLGTTWNKRETTESWIRNNISDEIVSRDYDYGNCYVRTTNNYYNTFYKIRCEQQKPQKGEINNSFELGIVNDMEVATKEWIKNLKWVPSNLPVSIDYSDENWGNCIIKFSDSTNNYTYTIKCRLKETIKILLPNSSNFQKTFTEWCNTNNYNNLPILNKKEINKIAIIESNYFNAHFDAKVTNLLVEGTVQIFDITHTETPLPLKQIEEYCNQLAAWMYRCDYKPDRNYNQHEVRNLLGRSDRYLYGITDTSNYYYKSGIFTDDWSIDGQTINGSYYRSTKYLDRNPAPKKPDCLTINEIKKCSDRNFALKFPIEDK